MNLKIILILSISHFVIDITGSALPVMMPFFKNSLQLTYTAVGTVIMVSNLTSSIIQPFFGHLSDKIEVKWLLPLSVGLTSAGFASVGFAPSFIILLVLVVVHGIGVAVYHPEGTKIMHYFTGSKKVTGMSFFQVGGNLGLALGPLLITYAIKLADLSGSLLFLIMGLPILVLLVFFLEEFMLPLRSEKRGVQASGGDSHSVKEESKWGSMVLLVLGVSMRSWVHMGLITFLPFYYIHVLKGDAFTAGKLVFVFLMGGVVGTVIGAIIADRIGHKYYFSLSMILSSPLLFLLLHLTGIWVFFILFFVGLVLISSFSVTIVMGQAIMKKRLGMASGLMMGFVVGMGGVGAGLLGILADSWGILMIFKLIAWMPVAGLIPILLIPYPPFHQRVG